MKVARRVWFFVILFIVILLIIIITNRTKNKIINKSHSFPNKNLIMRSDEEVDRLIKHRTKNLDASTPRRIPARIDLDFFDSLHFDHGVSAGTLYSTLGEPISEYWSSDLQANSTINLDHKKFKAIQYLMKSQDSSSIVFLLDEYSDKNVVRIYMFTILDEKNEKKLLWQNK